MIGKTILHYKIVEKLGEGGMGVVYKAEDTKLKREVAIKFLPQYISGNEEERKRFEIEAQAAASLNHPNITTIHSIEEVDDEMFIVMEYIEGTELKDKIKNGPIPTGEAINIAIQIAEGLETAHKKRIVHRDIKSQNIMITNEGKVKIMDFGLAKVGEGAKVTKIGTTVGTIAYMSPEQAQGEGVDNRTDIWSFGVVIYEMLTGQLPFKGAYDQAIIFSLFNEEPTPVSEINPDIPTQLILIIEKTLQKDRENRYRNMTELIGDLKEFYTQPANIVNIGKKNQIVLRGELKTYGILMGDTSETIIYNSIELFNNLISLNIKEFGGRIIKTPGLSIISTFKEPVNCITFIKSTLESITKLNSTLPVSQRVHYMFGIDYGEISESPDGPEGEAVRHSGELAGFSNMDGFRMSKTFTEKVLHQKDITLSETLFKDSYGEHQMPKQLESFDLPPPEQRPSIAILPFTSADDSESNAIAEGLRIDITNALMKIKEIFLIAPSSMNHFRGKTSDEVASHLGTRHILEGNVRRAGNKVRVTMQLTDTINNTLVWFENYDRLLDDSFSLQDEIAERIITELDVKLTLGEQAKVWRKCLIHPKAREFFYQGLNAFFKSTSESVLTAQKNFERVAEFVPESPVGATWTALSFWLLASHGWTNNPEETQALAASWAKRAVKMEDADGQAHTVLGAVLLFERRFDEALRIARDSVFIRPGCNTANGILANVLLHCGEYDEAIIHAKRAIRIGPVYPPFFLEILSFSYMEAGKVDFAISVCREIIRLVPETIHGRLLLISALIRSCWLAEARWVAKKVLELDKNFSINRFLKAQPFRSEDLIMRLNDELKESGLPV